MRTKMNFIIRHLKTSKTYYSILFLSLVIALFSCDKKQDQNKQIWLIGHLESDTIQQVYLIEHRYGFLWDKNPVIDSVTVDSNQFVFNIENAMEGFYLIKSIPQKLHGNFYLIPGDTLTVKFTETNEKEFLGKTADLQKFQLKAYEYLKNDSIYNNIYGKYFMLAQLEPEKAKAIIDTIRSREFHFFNQYFKGKNIPKKFKDIVLADINYGAANKYYSYLKYHLYYTKNEWEYLSVDSTYYKFLENIDLSFKDNAYIFSIVQFLEDHLNDQFIRRNKIYSNESQKQYLRQSKESELTFKQKWIKSNLGGVTHDLGLFTLYYTHFGSALHDSLDLFYNDIESVHSYFAENYTDSTVFKACEEIYNNYQRIKPGNFAPQLQLPDTNGNIISLDNFKGKVVYIDFWGTWCGPCIKAIPDHLALQEKFADQDVVFLNVALEAGEKEIQLWKKFIREEDFQGIHVVAENQFNNKEIQPFMINWAPTYILIDQKGRMVLPKAPEPDKAEEAIKGLLAI